jgi:hypothetical protein
MSRRFGCVAPLIVQFELDRQPRRNVFTLRCSKLVEPVVVLIEYVEAVCNFGGPEFEVRNMPGKLVRIQRDEPRQL